MTRVDFWYEFASTYSYPAAMRIEAIAADRGIEVRWRPFLLGPIFGAQGWRNSPFNIYPSKGRYMWRDLERICMQQNLPMRRPDPFPQNSVHAARVALALADADRPAYSRAVYTAQFADGRAIADRGVIAAILTDLGHRPAEVAERATSEAIKRRLQNETEDAQRVGIFGAPSFVAEDGELFWGNDRLDDALDWAIGKR